MKEKINALSHELVIANNEHSLRSVQNEKCEEKLSERDIELAFQNNERKKRAAELVTIINELRRSEEKLVRAKLQTSNFAEHLHHVQEEEKAYIAREIHDEFGQQLAGMKIDLSMLQRNKNRTVLEIDGSINIIMGEVDALIKSLNQIATSLRPGILDTLGLIPSLEWHVKEFERHTGIKCQMEIDVAEQKFDKKVSICFFRICQEALTNISKHAKAKNVKVRIFQSKAELSMKISDDGGGIATDKLKNPFSMGLIGMKERAKIIAADLSIANQINGGTVVELKLLFPGAIKYIPKDGLLNILLAEDDVNDGYLFEKALKEIAGAATLITVRDGEQAMKYLAENSHHLPDVLFLDISMPRKTGIECLSEIKENKDLKGIPIVMFTLFFPHDKGFEKSMKDTLSGIGANEYITKTGNLMQLKQSIQNALIKVFPEPIEPKVLPN